MIRATYTLVFVLMGSSIASAQAAHLLPHPTLSIEQPPALGQQRPPVDSDPKPTSGLGPMIAGWVGTGLGVINLATIPICFADFYPHNAQDLCLGLSLVIGGVALAVGIPLLIVGYNQRSTFNAWRAREHGRRGIAEHLLNLRGRSGAMGAWSCTEASSERRLRLDGSSRTTPLLPRRLGRATVLLELEQ